MSANKTLSDNGLITGALDVTIDGYVYRLTGTLNDGSEVQDELDSNGIFLASHSRSKKRTFSGNIRAYSGIPKPPLRKPFQATIGGYDLYWQVVTCNETFEAGPLKGYAVEIHQLGGDSASDFVETPES